MLEKLLTSEVLYYMFIMLELTVGSLGNFQSITSSTAEITKQAIFLKNFHKISIKSFLRCRQFILLPIIIPILLKKQQQQKLLICFSIKTTTDLFPHGFLGCRWKGAWNSSMTDVIG